VAHDQQSKQLHSPPVIGTTVGFAAAAGSRLRGGCGIEAKIKR
jgi:hypothetical protein